MTLTTASTGGISEYSISLSAEYVLWLPNIVRHKHLREILPRCHLLQRGPFAARRSTCILWKHRRYEITTLLCFSLKLVYTARLFDSVQQCANRHFTRTQIHCDCPWEQECLVGFIYLMGLILISQWTRCKRWVRSPRWAPQTLK